MCHTLIIEDEFSIADYISELAGQAGATSFYIAETQSDAVSAARIRKPDVIISDVRLLKGNGPAAVALIEAEAGPIAVMFVTSNPEECPRRDPAVVVISKPFQAQYFQAEFRKLVPLPLA